MKFVWTVVLLASILFSVAVPMFFGHALASEEGRGAWFGAAAVCLAIAAVLIFIQRRVNPDNVPH